MIRYSLRCAEGHRFESWFQSASAFDSLCAAQLVECPICGGREVEKSVMAPRLGKANRAETAETESASTNTTPVTDTAQTFASEPPAEVTRALKRLKAAVEANSDYVGPRFAQEARRIHSGEAEARSIHGEAGPGDAKALMEDGIPVLPLPFVSTRKSN